MKNQLITLIIFNTLLSFSQKNGCYFKFSAAFKNIDSVKSITINCMHCNEFGTDGCDSLPNDIGKFYNLHSLIISESKIKTLPNSINQLKRLKRLSLNCLYNFNYENELCKLQELDSLEYLELNMSNIKELPNCITQIKSIKQIDISFIEELNIKNAIKVLKQLPNLETLDLSGIDKLNVIPENIKEIKNLKTLKINHMDYYFNYKKSLDRLSSLKIKSLYLKNNGLDNKHKPLPHSIVKLKELEFIDLSDNFFESLPIELFKLTNLKTIIISHNNNTLQNIGDSIINLKNLEKIDLSNNWKLNGKQTIISLSKLPNLKILDLSGCRLDTIPDEIMNFPALEKLILTNNPELNFADLLKKLSFIRTLKYLDLSNNNLTTLPKEIGLLTSLEYLVIGLNNTITFPGEFFNLKNLKVINLYGYFKNAYEVAHQTIKEKLPGCKIIKDWIFRN
ncbi:MAG: hypothetical protein KatS3mg027_1701 [Bacteroidia bacterium]|nr:MAG: hypothetical protein KatS3mg027_1701 [Bacteroidia bacterium]